MVLGIPVILQGKGIAQVIGKKMMGDKGFEPVTSTVGAKKKGKREM
jgi:hypothetical protein